VDRVVTARSDRLDGRTAVVAGAGSSGPGIGIGRATSVALARLGATVVAVDRSATALEETVDLVIAAGGRARAVVGDVTTESTARAAADVAVQLTGRLDILVNNVGMVAARLTPAIRERHRMACPLRVEGTAWEVADVISFLVGDRARWITGVVLPVDGGLTAVVPATEGRSAGDADPGSSSEAR
jgi:NAD(P)-dependent dehydrogenase (short-subunit alcohol dehydrogenase family)